MVMKSRAVQIASVDCAVTATEGHAMAEDGTLAVGIADFYGFAQYNAVSGEKLAVGTSGEFTGIVGGVAVTAGQKLKILNGTLVDAVAGTENCLAMEDADAGENVLVKIISSIRY